MMRVGLLLITALMLLPLPQVFAEDMRVLQRQVLEQRRQLEEQAAADRQAARLEEQQSREQISHDRATLTKAMAALQQQLQQLQQKAQHLDKQNRDLAAQDQQLSSQLAAADSMVREAVGVIRLNAKDVAALVRDNLQSAVAHPDLSLLEQIAGQTHFPGMTDIRKLVELIFTQLQSSGEVALTQAGIVDRSGHEAQGQVLTIGPFTAIYEHDGEVGFLNYSAAGGNLYALSRLPSGRQQRQIRDYLQGKSAAVPVDVARGAALQQLTHKLSLWQQIQRGGLLVWPILAILFIGIVLSGERMLFLVRKRCNGDILIRQLDELAAKRDWPACQNLCTPFMNKPVARVLQAGLNSHKASREDMEDVLQEAILKEIPPLERFLATLGMLAAIAPLLGLLGTVTGMIDTFQIMTQFGTGDPRMMSGGISVALVTTMLGLSVAIPIMLAHTLLGRAVDNSIAQLEEKAVALVNIMQKNR